MKESLQKVIRLHDGFMSWFGFVAPVITRIVLGYSMWIDGQGKLNNLDKVVDNLFSKLYLPFSDIPLPQPALQARTIGELEYIGGFLLLIGLFTRPAALALAGAMLGAVLLSDSPALIQKWSDGSPLDEASFTNFLLCLWLFFWGPGAFSIDSIVAYFVRRWAGEEPPVRDRYRPVIACWVLRTWVILFLLALVPVSDGTADTMMKLGIKSKLVRAPHQIELDSQEKDAEPLTSVTEYPPNLLGLGLYALAALGLGAAAWKVLAPRPDKSPKEPSAAAS